MIGLTLVTFLYARRQRISWLSLADNIAVVAPVGLFLGRCANFINGELYGRATTVPWAMQFPKEAIDLPAVGARILAAAHAVRAAGDRKSVTPLIEQARSDGALQTVLPSDSDPAASVAALRGASRGRVSFSPVSGFCASARDQPRGMLAGLFLLLYAAG